MLGHLIDYLKECNEENFDNDLLGLCNRPQHLQTRSCKISKAWDVDNTDHN